MQVELTIREIQELEQLTSKILENVTASEIFDFSVYTPLHIKLSNALAAYDMQNISHDSSVSNTDTGENFDDTPK